MSRLSSTDLQAIRDRATWSTEGPWAPWYDQDGAPHMNHLLMVGNAAAVIPEGESWVEDVDVNPIAHVYTPEDREFIAHARTDIPALLAHIDDLATQLEIARGERFGTDPAALGQAFAAVERIVALEAENKELRRTIADEITR